MSILEKFTPARLLHQIDDLDKRAKHKNYSPEERKRRCDLAAAYRLCDLYGWSEGIYNHITVRLPGHEDRFLMNPFGLQFHEITASSLITVDPSGKIVDPGSTNFGPNPRGFTLHSAVHQARTDLQCVLHLHVPEVIAISSTKKGFLPLCQEGLGIGHVAELEFSGILTDLGERESIVKALGKNNMLLLRNHGFVSCGTSVADAMFKAYFFLYNVKAQLHLSSIDTHDLILPTPEATKRCREALAEGEKTESEAGTSIVNGHSDQAVKWGVGGIDWEANMRLLDSMGLKTGYEYRLNVFRDEANGK